MESDADSTAGEAPVAKPKEEPADTSMKDENIEEDEEQDDEDEEMYVSRLSFAALTPSLN